MSTIQITTLFTSSLFHIDEFRSPFLEPQVSEEEWTHEHAVAFVRAGTYLCYSPLGLAIANPNHVLFFNRQQPYQVRRPFADEEHTVEIVLDQQTLFEMIAPAPNSNNPDTLFRTESALVNSSHLLRLYQLLQLINETNRVDSLAIEELTLLLVADALDRVNQLKPISNGIHRSSTERVHHDLTQHAKLVIGEQFRDKLSLEYIAQQVHSSTYHLSRVFRRQTGSSLYQYLQQMRLSCALNLLVESPQTNLSTLALDLGFSSHGHFSTVFTTTFGMTPSTFRQTANTRLIDEMSKNLKA